MVRLKLRDCQEKHILTVSNHKPLFSSFEFSEGSILHGTQQNISKCVIKGCRHDTPQCCIRVSVIYLGRDSRLSEGGACPVHVWWGRVLASVVVEAEAHPVPLPRLALA